MDHSGKSQLPAVHIHMSARLCTRHARTGIHTQCPTFHPAGTLTDITHFQLCHGCALASHYRPRITSITGELLNSESGGYID